MNFGCSTQTCEYLSNKRLILYQKEPGTLFFMLTIEESNDSMWQSTTQKKMCARSLQNKIFKAQMCNKSCLEKEEGDTFPLKSFEILPFKSRVELLAVQNGKADTT